MTKLDGQRVVVIGGSSGLGLATARRLLDHGARVVVASRRREKLAAARQALGDEATFRQVDVRDGGTLTALFEDLGSLDHLVVSVSGGRTGPFPGAGVEEARPVLEVQFWGYYRAARHAVSHLAERGSITFISGTFGRKPGATLPTVTVTKAAVDSLTRSLAVKLAPRRVNCVAPGPVRTPLWEALFPDEAERSREYEKAARRLLVGRMGSPEEVAHAVHFLIANRFVTGTVLDVDGGDLLT